MASQDESRTTDQSMQAGKFATGERRGKDRPARSPEHDPAEGGTPEQGMRAGKLATGKQRGQDRR
jgi:hypothetical protein